MLDLACSEDARERRGNQLHAFGAIDPGAVTLETENQPSRAPTVRFGVAGATTVPRTMRGTGHLHLPARG
jgi:hypothetical protein